MTNWRDIRAYLKKRCKGHVLRPSEYSKLSHAVRVNPARYYEIEAKVKEEVKANEIMNRIEKQA